VVQQPGMPDRQDECWFVEQRMWQRATTVAHDGRQLQRVHSLIHGSDVVADVSSWWCMATVTKSTLVNDSTI